jgi:hypothetical protein
MAHAHPGAAAQLLLDQPGVERAAHLVGRLDVEHGDLAGLVIDLDLHHQRGMGKVVTGVISPVSGSTSDSGIRKMPRPAWCGPA